MVNAKSTSNCRVKTKYQEELQILSSNTVAKKETMMVKYVNTFSAVWTMVRSHRDMQVTAETVLVSLLNVLIGLILVFAVPVPSCVPHGRILVNIARVVVSRDWHK